MPKINWKQTFRDFIKKHKPKRVEIFRPGKLLVSPIPSSEDWAEIIKAFEGAELLEWDGEKFVPVEQNGEVKPIRTQESSGQSI